MSSQEKLNFLEVEQTIDNILGVKGSEQIRLDPKWRSINVELLGEKTLRAGEFGQPVTNYCLAVDIGYPSKTYRLQLELATNEIFVPHYELIQELRRRLGLRTYLRNDRSYRCKTSAEGRKIDQLATRDIHLNGYCLTGKMYEDVVRITVHDQPGDIMNIVGIRQNFIAIKRVNRVHLSRLPIHGYLGLGPMKQSKIGVKNLLFNLKECAKIERLIFSIYFNRYTPKINLILGGIDKARYREPVRWHSSEHDRWTLRPDRVRFGSKILYTYLESVRKDCRAVITTGLNEIYAPIDTLRKIYLALGACPGESGLAYMSQAEHTNLPALEFDIDDTTYSIKPQDYIKWSEFGSYLAIFPSKNDHEWILGSIFLERFYSIFDAENHKIGFASLSDSHISFLSYKKKDPI